jgi:hypothetical protein
VALPRDRPASGSLHHRDFFSGARTAGRPGCSTDHPGRCDMSARRNPPGGADGGIRVGAPKATIHSGRAAPCVDKTAARCGFHNATAYEGPSRRRSDAGRTTRLLEDPLGAGSELTGRARCVGATPVNRCSVAHDAGSRHSHGDGGRRVAAPMCRRVRFATLRAMHAAAGCLGRFILVRCCR